MSDAELYITIGLLGKGKPLDEAIRRRMEAHFGCELKDVCIHDSRQASEMARKLGAEAFTMGSHIFASDEKLNTLTLQGMGLLAHELTHVVQQTHPRSLEHGKIRTAEVAPGADSLSIKQESTMLQFAAPSYARLSPGISRMEDEAQANEQAMREVLESGGEMENPNQEMPQINAEDIADRVYHLMRQDLILEGERAVHTKR
jgi:hypothetical protein